MDLHFTTDTVIRITRILAYIVVTLTSLAMLQTVALRRIAERRARERVQFNKTWRPVLAAAAYGDAVDAPPLERDQRRLFLEEWNNFLAHLEGAGRERMIEIGVQVDMRRLAHKLLKAVRPSDRLLGILTLGNLRDAESWDVLEWTMKNRTGLVAMAALRSLARIDGQRALREFSPLILIREDWPLALSFRIIRENLPHNPCAIFAEHLNLLDEKPLLRALSVIEHLKCYLPRKSLERIIISSESIDLISHCLRVMQDPSARDLLRSYMGHDNAWLRLNALRAYGALADGNDVGIFVPLLSDPEWWVRYRAAQAIRGIPNKGIEFLKELQPKLFDNYAYAIVDQVIAETEMGWI